MVKRKFVEVSQEQSSKNEIEQSRIGESSSAESLQPPPLQVSGLRSEANTYVNGATEIEKIHSLEQRNQELVQLVNDLKQSQDQLQFQLSQQKSKNEQLDQIFNLERKPLQERSHKEQLSFKEQLQVLIQHIGILNAEKKLLHSCLFLDKQTAKQNARKVEELQVNLSKYRQSTTKPEQYIHHLHNSNQQLEKVSQEQSSKNKMEQPRIGESSSAESLQPPPLQVGGLRSEANTYINGATELEKIQSLEQRNQELVQFVNDLKESQSRLQFQLSKQKATNELLGQIFNLEGKPPQEKSHKEQLSFEEQLHFLIQNIGIQNAEKKVLHSSFFWSQQTAIQNARKVEELQVYLRKYRQWNTLLELYILHLYISNQQLEKVSQEQSSKNEMEQSRIGESSSAESLQLPPLQIGGLYINEATELEKIQSLEQRNQELVQLVNDLKESQGRLQFQLSEQKAKNEQLDQMFNLEREPLHERSHKEQLSIKEQLKVLIQNIGILSAEQKLLHSSLLLSQEAAKQNARKVEELQVNLSKSRQSTTKLEQYICHLYNSNQQLEKANGEFIKDIEGLKPDHFKFNKGMEEYKSQIDELTEKLTKQNNFTRRMYIVHQILFNDLRFVKSDNDQDPIPRCSSEYILI